MAHDDVFRIHCTSSFDGKSATLRERNLALRPGVTYEHQWLIVPLSKPSYWAFVNALRRSRFVQPAADGQFPCRARLSGRRNRSGETKPANFSGLA